MCGEGTAKIPVQCSFFNQRWCLLLCCGWARERVPVAPRGQTGVCCRSQQRESLAVKFSSGSKCTVEATICPYMNNCSSIFKEFLCCFPAADQIERRVWWMNQQRTLLRQVAKMLKVWFRPMRYCWEASLHRLKWEWICCVTRANTSNSLLFRTVNMKKPLLSLV